MAIVMMGASVCPLCNKIIEEHESIVMFPPFVQNVKDSFYVFNDAGVHFSCVERHILGKQALIYRDNFLFKTRPENRICDIGGNKIESPSDYLFFDLLTSNVSESLNKFNFITIDKRNISKWKEKDEFLNLATKFLEDDKWGNLTDFNYLNYLITEVS